MSKRAYGEQMPLEQCLYGVMLESANECAYAVAEHVGGTVENFVDMMNAKAKELGCTNTHFANPHGLQDENHYTTAHDMALIAQAAYQNETFRIIIGTKMYTIPPTNKHAEETVLRNHHDMLCTYHNANRKYLYPYCVGGKTGYTATANSTLVTYAEKDGMTLICVVMNTQSPNQFIDTVNLFDYAFDNFQVLNVSENDTDYSAEATVDNGNLNNIAPFVELDKDAVIVLPKTAEFSDTSSSVEYNDSDSEIAGSITYTYAGRNVGKADIKTTGVVVEGYAFDNESTEEDVVGDGFDVDEDVARDDPRAFAVAVIERDDVGEVIVPEVLAVHLQQPLRRAENIGDVAQRVALPCGHFVQPSCREALLRESVGAVVGKVSDSHFFRCCYVVVRPGADGVPATARNRMKRRFYFRKHSSARIFCPGLGG